MTPRIGSLFSGVGGLDLAVEAFFSGVTVWHCELAGWRSTPSYIAGGHTDVCRWHA